MYLFFNKAHKTIVARGQTTQHSVWKQPNTQRFRVPNILCIANCQFREPSDLLTVTGPCQLPSKSVDISVAHTKNMPVLSDLAHSTTM